MCVCVCVCACVRVYNVNRKCAHHLLVALKIRGRVNSHKSVCVGHIDQRSWYEELR